MALCDHAVLKKSITQFVQIMVVIVAVSCQTQRSETQVGDSLDSIAHADTSLKIFGDSIIQPFADTPIQTIKRDTIYFHPDSMKELHTGSLVIRYPANTLIVNPKINTQEPGRAGSFLCVDFNRGSYNGTGCFFQEMIFHTLESCSNYTSSLKPEDMEGDFFYTEWYHPDEFRKQKKVYEERLSEPTYQLLRTPSGRKFVKGANTYIYFQNEIRVMAYFEANGTCDVDVFEKLLENIVIEIN